MTKTIKKRNMLQIIIYAFTTFIAFLGIEWEKWGTQSVGTKRRTKAIVI